MKMFFLVALQLFCFFMRAASDTLDDDLQGIEGKFSSHSYHNATVALTDANCSGCCLASGQTSSNATEPGGGAGHYDKIWGNIQDWANWFVGSVPLWSMPPNCTMKPNGSHPYDFFLPDDVNNATAALGCQFHCFKELLWRKYLISDLLRNNTAPLLWQLRNITNPYTTPGCECGY
ncbi:MAG: hypothetical protein M1820_008274 [Bogoriella megaspora]|nr:MAG: hypothetical protein M1820_008274 [Bogoriella megaspora]